MRKIKISKTKENKIIKAHMENMFKRDLKVQDS